MNAVVHQNGHVRDIPPPSDKKQEIKDKLSLVLEMAWLLVLIFPHILLAVFRKLFPPSEKSLEGQVVLVTGAGRGLGRGLALGFAKEGCKVAVVDVNDSALKTAAEINNSGATAKAFFTNVAKVDEVKALRQAVTRDLGPVDILVNNAGLIYAGNNVEECAEEEINAVISVNLLSHFWMIREFLPTMKEHNSGHIVAIASVASFFGVATGTAYVASKFGVRGLMEVVRAELETRSHNRVKTTTVFPYFINTSAHYVDHWDLRVPPITIEEAVESTITAVRRDEVSASVPGFLFPLMNFGRLIPRNTMDKFMQCVYFKMIPQTKKEKENDPVTHMAKLLSKLK